MLEIQAGSVFHVWCQICRPQKWKFFVVAYVDPAVRYFIINSAPAAFQRNSPTLLRHQAELLAAEHGFLHHDSVLNCSEVFGGPTASDLEDMYSNDEAVLLGRLSPSAMQQVRGIVEGSELLSPKEIAAVLACW